MILIENIFGTKDAPTILLFGGNPSRRLEVLKLISQLGNISILGALSEEEGIEIMKKTCKVDLVLIGGAYTFEQRFRIKNFIEEHDKNIEITEPGVEYLYSNQNIKDAIINKINFNQIIT
ncbi:hypothetical protein [Aquimarina mytili]|uniref:Uncharacterized protein n=1 Tax=Aquimarina mytili TaxID=874423 RepID=A0A936ZZC4_9FLAO|nr:hypothetical protein [Aquimarina mytili]MBL0684758.1 hypothetical protein [Aquimarina mytili]